MFTRYRYLLPLLEEWLIVKSFYSITISDIHNITLCRTMLCENILNSVFKITYILVNLHSSTSILVLKGKSGIWLHPVDAGIRVLTMYLVLPLL